MSVKLLTEQHSEFLSLEGVCTVSSECTHVKMPHCLKSHVAAQIINEEIKETTNKLTPFQIFIESYRT